MPAEQIVIDIQNTVKVEGQGSSGAGAAKISAEKAASGEIDKAAQTLNMMTLIRSLGRLGIALSGSSDQMRELVQSVQKGVRYGSLAARALSGAAVGDYTQMVQFAIVLASDAITTAQQAAAKVAAQNNSADAAAIQAGILNVENADITPNWWDGRYSYSGR